MDYFMDTMRYGKAALRKFGAVPEGFHIYSAEWLGGPTPAERTRMRVTGAEFKGKGRVSGTTMTTIVTLEEIEARRSRISKGPSGGGIVASLEGVTGRGP